MWVSRANASCITLCATWSIGLPRVSDVARRLGSTASSHPFQGRVYVAQLQAASRVGGGGVRKSPVIKIGESYAVKG